VTRLSALAPGPVGVTAWHPVTQEQVNLFADATGDHQWIHVDPERAAAGPFGAPVAHGYLTLAMIPRLLFETLTVEDADLVVNKEMRALKFAAPVMVGSRVRAVLTLSSIRRRPKGFWELVFEVAVEIEDTGAMALTAETVFLYREAVLDNSGKAAAITFGDRPRVAS
jgi:acyl dehydratase